jgi:hypothetical protein
MKSITRKLLQSVLIIVVAAGCWLAQTAEAETHAKDLQGEQTQAMIVASPLCQQVRSGKESDTVHDVDPSTLVDDLSSLTQKSDEVLLVGNPAGHASMISPNGLDVFDYIDARVLRVWKGSHKAGDVVTFALPFGLVFCEPWPVPHPHEGRPFMAGTHAHLGDFAGYIHGPHVLFLRQSQGDEMQLTPGLRLTGGGGFQGMYGLKEMHVHADACSKADVSGVAEDIAACNELLDRSYDLVSSSSVRDLLTKKWTGKPMLSFLKAVQAAADSSAL